MRLIRIAIIPIAIFACLVLTGISFASVITVDVDGKKATSDVTSLELSTVRVSGDQVGVNIKNTMLEPQLFTLKFHGLIGSSSYDVYINHSFVGSKPSKEFEAGVEYRVDGTITDPDMMRCLKTARDPIDKALASLKKSTDPEAKRVSYTLNQAKTWVQSGIKRDEAFRSVSIILAPSGKMLQSMTWLTREGEYETARAVTRGCWLLQQARTQMSKVIKNPSLRNEAVAAMTPLDLTANYSTLNGKPHVTVKLLNKCNLPISGIVSMALPQGWKTTAKKRSFDNLKSGQTFGLSFDLIAPSKQAAAPDNVPIAVSVTIAQEQLIANMKLNVTALKTAEVKPCP